MKFQAILHLFSIKHILHKHVNMFLKAKFEGMYLYIYLCDRKLKDNAITINFIYTGGII